MAPIPEIVIEIRAGSRTLATACFAAVGIDCWENTHSSLITIFTCVFKFQANNLVPYLLSTLLSSPDSLVALSLVCG